MAESFVNNLLLTELIKKREKNENETFERINEEYEKMMKNCNYNANRIIQLWITECEVLLKKYNEKVFSFFSLTRERLQKASHYRFDDKYYEILDFIKDMNCYLPKKNYTSNLHVCPEMNFLYDHGFLEFTVQFGDRAMYLVGSKKLIAFNVLKKYLIVDLIQVVLKFID